MQSIQSCVDCTPARFVYWEIATVTVRFIYAQLIAVNRRHRNHKCTVSIKTE